jgi:aminopeptidase N/puromycin-sensitive aminopeptidase
MRLRLLAAAAALLASSALTAQRLPSGIRPDHYALHFTPDLKTATFTGEETIDLTLDAPQISITLNSIDLKIASVKTANGEAATISYDESKQQATFTFPTALSVGKNQLAITFTGILNDKLRGFYLSKTAKRSYAVTQFESTDARRAFPSFDEPALKATFDISLTVDKDDTVISNGPQIYDKKEADKKHTLTFATTPRMSTYLVAFQVGDFECSKGKSDGIPIRACATPDKVEQTKFAVKAAEHFLHYYNNYFGIKYPMQKLDMVGIPDFEAGAMENFGCITYRETDLLLDEKNAPIPAMQRVAVVVAHEMSHQWFGDMVTMQWWDNIWLNEGFANWMESKAVNDWKPELLMRDDEANTLNDTLNLDSTLTTHPIRATADTPAQIEEMFDGISYGKGGSMIGMVEHYLGEETFRQGVHNYLAAHMWSNATAEDFWNAQTANAHKPVDRIMSSFIEQPGVPLLQLGPATNGIAAIAQSRFLLARDAQSSQQQSWTIPVCVKGSPCQVLTPEATTLKLPTNATLYANADFKGYYRTAYAPADLHTLLASAPTLSAPERIGLISDQWAFVRASSGHLADYLDLVTTLHADNDASVLDSALTGVTYLRSRIADDHQREQMNTWIRAQFGPIYHALPKAKRNDDPNLRQRRASLFNVLGYAGDPAAVAEAHDLATRYFKHDLSLEPQMATIAIAIAARTGDAAYYDQVLSWSRTTDDPRNRAAALATLADFTNPVLVERTLQLAISGEVRNQDSYTLLTRLLAWPETRPQAWKFIKENWDRTKATLTIFSGQRLIQATGSFCSTSERKDVADFFNTHPVPAAERALSNALNAIDTCLPLRASLQPELDHWLQQHPQ